MGRHVVDAAEHDELRWVSPADLDGLRLADPRLGRLVERLVGRSAAG